MPAEHQGDCVSSDPPNSVGRRPQTGCRSTVTKVTELNECREKKFPQSNRVNVEIINRMRGPFDFLVGAKGTFKGLPKTLSIVAEIFPD